MPRHAARNLYPGVNAHLNSFLQSEDSGWESFHTEYLVALARTLDTLLPENYYAVSEKSLQISLTSDDSETRRRVRPDITIFERESIVRSGVYPESVSAPTLTLPLAETLEEDEDERLTSILIYQLDEGKFPGKPVIRLELLSPANKPPQRHHAQYLIKRLQTLYSGLSLVEINFLHEQRPVLSVMPSYPERHEDAFPYTIYVNNPHPQASQGHIDVYGVGIVQPLPTVTIPLADNDYVPLNFNEVYNRVYEAVRVYSFLVDYESEPVNFARYRPEDQAKIKALIDEIRAS